MLSILFTEGVSDSYEFHILQHLESQCEDYPVCSPKIQVFSRYLRVYWCLSSCLREELAVLKIVHCIFYSFPQIGLSHRLSQAAQVVNSLPARAGDVTEVGSAPAGKIP